MPPPTVAELRVHASTQTTSRRRRVSSRHQTTLLTHTAAASLATRATHPQAHATTTKNVDSLATGCVIVAAADGRSTARPRKHPNNKTQAQSVIKASNDPSYAHGSRFVGHTRNAPTSPRNNNKKRRLTSHWLCWRSRRRRSRNCASTQAPKQQDAGAECHQGIKRPFLSTRQPLRWPRAQRTHKHTQQQQKT